MHCVRRILNVTYQNSQICNKVNNVNRICERLRVLRQNTAYRFNHDSKEESAESEEKQNEYTELSNRYIGTAAGHRIFVLQPYIKWGRDKKRNTTPELQMAEAVALINTLPYWCVVGCKYAPLLTLEKKALLGTGAIDNLKRDIHKCDNPSAIFISTNQLKFVQMVQLEKIFGLPIYDRYSIVIHIFRQHAKSPEAKVQVALAEIPYIRKKMLETSIGSSGKANITDKIKLMLNNRERKLKNDLSKLQQHRQLTRKSRQKTNMPTVAVVGYTNSGKTSLIKALTDDQSLQPENKLFATLDTTAHRGMLLNKLKVIYMDTIGFIQDVPETLIEPFIVTLEDAIIADVIIHIYDVSHPDMTAQYEHVQNTIKPMIGENRLVIDVANKCDLVESDCIPKDAIAVSATKLTGIDLLRLEIEKVVLGTVGLLRTRVRVENGSVAASWLYKWTTVMNAIPDPNNAQYLIMDVLATSRDIQQFKQFLRQ
ncbi:PREDICTED: putative GTP-binding protein 6 [Dinoponera quadriceps]|uniref:GTP-binding protein 6 n=1 Tax=Dinoponera quadriceps TaxID=609295 RepID=A0A6P3XXI0_DINQU|nr:PREDICTED: putative GTP-binding protein 6 [Dinoponera quadriceps]XP_014482798.1 PREDICTED: putative GTP-binding protein 6 [Dinoponera quadriceps]XP_014482799.1 PREDICTED: putative GTP-binding protein 6 [Dinoponera quadriceps]